jgi:hypothetical protein
MPLPVRPGVITGPVVVIPTPPKPPVGPTLQFKDINPDIRLPDNLGRPPKATDLIINRGFDGATTDQAVAAITKNLSNPLAPQNAALVKQQATDRYRDFNVTLNNVFTANSPNRQWLDSLKPTAVSVQSTMSAMQPITYKVTTADGQSKYYARDWSGRFAETQPPKGVVMDAALRLSPTPGIIMTYPKWSNPALSQAQLSTVTEG